MKNTQASDSYKNGEENLLPEYNFDDRKARPNRFATQKGKAAVTVTLDADFAEVFTTLEAVNNTLHALLSAIPKNALGE
jgi:hypothetical protein